MARETREEIGVAKGCRAVLGEIGERRLASMTEDLGLYSAERTSRMFYPYSEAVICSVKIPIEGGEMEERACYIGGGNIGERTELQRPVRK